MLILLHRYINKSLLFSAQNMFCNVILDINTQLLLNYVSRGKPNLPQYIGHFWARAETVNMIVFH